MHLDLQLSLDVFVYLFLGAVVIAASSALGRRFTIPSPLILVVVGVAVSLAGFAPEALAYSQELTGHQLILSQVILQGLLPPLLYASAVSLPAMDFRRDFTAISLLAVLLVLVTAVGVGWLVHWLLGVPLAIGIALGASLSPTDAVAVAIVERLGSPPRLVTILEGEAMINDASALAIMATALAAAGVGPIEIDVTPLGVTEAALWMVGVAVVAGAVIGRLGLWLSSKCQDPVLSILVALLISFAAYIPVNALDASGLVAVVVAGLVNGQGAPRHVAVRNRIAQAQTWETIEFLLEGAVFLLMGLQLRGLWEAHGESNDISPGVTVAVALAAGTAVMAIRAVFVTPLVKVLRVRAQRLLQQRRRAAGSLLGRQARVAEIRAAMNAGVTPPSPGSPASPNGAGPREDPALRQARQARRARRRLADADYLASKPMGWREGSVLVWAGMRGVVTLAAAQSFPVEGVDKRAALILVAFTVAAVSLFGQAGTLPWRLRRFQLTGRVPVAEARERDRLQRRLATGAVAHLHNPLLTRASGRPYSQEAINIVSDTLNVDLNLDEIEDVPAESLETAPDASQLAAEALHQEVWELRLSTVRAMRRELFDAQAVGTFASQAVKEALEELDSDEISVTMRRENEE
jgi:CPA1 family monovalent cation:H+ antiporter